jgi:hypothetical protein
MVEDGFLELGEDGLEFLQGGFFRHFQTSMAGRNWPFEFLLNQLAQNWIRLHKEEVLVGGKSPDAENSVFGSPKGGVNIYTRIVFCRCPSQC